MSVKRKTLLYQKASILTGLGNTETSHIKLVQFLGLLPRLHLGTRARHINSCRAKPIANSIFVLMVCMLAGCSSNQKKNISQIQPERTALLLIEFQNEWLEQGHYLNGLIKGYLKRFNTIKKSRELIKYARKKDILVIHAPLIFSPDYREIPNPRGLQKNIVKYKLFMKGSKSAEIYRKVAPGDKDIIVKNRTGLSCFTGSNLEKVLKEHKIKNIILAGFANNVCVTYTGADAFDRGYNVFLAKDAVATFDQPSLLTFLGVSVLGRIGETIHKEALGEVLTNEELIQRTGGSHE